MTPLRRFDGRTFRSPGRFHRFDRGQCRRRGEHDTWRRKHAHAVCIEVDHRVVLVHAVNGAVAVLRMRNAISRRVLQHLISRASFSGRDREPTLGAGGARRHRRSSENEPLGLMRKGSASRNGMLHKCTGRSGRTQRRGHRRRRLGRDGGGATRGGGSDVFYDERNMNAGREICVGEVPHLHQRSIFPHEVVHAVLLRAPRECIP